VPGGEGIGVGAAVEPGAEGGATIGSAGAGVTLREPETGAKGIEGPEEIGAGARFTGKEIKAGPRAGVAGAEIEVEVEAWPDGKIT
jgi:hypothetical protein